MKAIKNVLNAMIFWSDFSLSLLITALKVLAPITLRRTKVRSAGLLEATGARSRGDGAARATW